MALRDGIKLRGLEMSVQETLQLFIQPPDPNRTFVSPIFPSVYSYCKFTFVEHVECARFVKSVRRDVQAAVPALHDPFEHVETVVASGNFLGNRRRVFLNFSPMWRNDEQSTSFDRPYNDFVVLVFGVLFRKLTKILICVSHNCLGSLPCLKSYTESWIHR